MPDLIIQEHEPVTEVDPINAAVVADNIPEETASALAAQSMAQSLAIATSDATALLRSVESAMSAVQSAALTRWIEAGSGEEDPRYQVIVRAAGQVIADAVALWRDINATAQQLLDALTDEGERVEPGSTVVDATSAEAPKSAGGKKKKAAKKKAAKKKASKKAAAKKQAVAKKAAKKPAPKAAKKKPAAKKAAKKPAAKKQPAVKPVPTPVTESADRDEVVEAAASNE